MSAELNPNAAINLSKAVVLVVETTVHAADILGQILKGFGVAETHRTNSVREASDLLRTKSFDLILIDPDAEGGRGTLWCGICVRRWWSRTASRQLS